MSPPFPVVRARLERALARRDLAGVRSAARELPSVVTLADAVLDLVLMLEADDSAFEAAAVRWLVRFTAECAGVTRGEGHAALEALEALPTADARTTLRAAQAPRVRLKPKRRRHAAVERSLALSASSLAAEAARSR